MPIIWSSGHWPATSSFQKDLGISLQWQRPNSNLHKTFQFHLVGAFSIISGGQASEGQLQFQSTTLAFHLCFKSTLESGK